MLWSFQSTFIYITSFDPYDNLICSFLQLLSECLLWSNVLYVVPAAGNIMDNKKDMVIDCMELIC